MRSGDETIELHGDFHMGLLHVVYRIVGNLAGHIVIDIYEVKRLQRFMKFQINYALREYLTNSH